MPARRLYIPSEEANALLERLGDMRESPLLEQVRHRYSEKCCCAIKAMYNYERGRMKVVWYACDCLHTGPFDAG